jgi:hypothetical protein
LEIFFVTHCVGTTVHAHTYHILNIHLNIILPSMLGSSKWYLFLRFHYQYPVYTSPLPHTCYISRQSHSRFDNPKKFSEWYRLLSSSLCSLLHPRVPPRPKYSPQHPILKRRQPAFLPQCERPSFKITGKIIILCILIFIYFLDSELEDSRFCTEC